MSSVTTGTIQTSNRAQGVRNVFRKVFSFPMFLGMLLLAAVYVASLGILRHGPSQFHSLAWLGGDTWWHLVVAARILKTHVWPTHDIYSFTAFGTPWIDYEWLGDIVLELFMKHSGLQGLMVFVVAAGTAVMGLLYYYASQRSGNSKAAFVASAVLLPLASAQFTARPQLLGYILLIITFICLEKFREGRSEFLWLLPLVFWLWVNTHGTFVLGFVILGVYWLSGLRGFHYGRIYAKQWTPKQRYQLELTFLICLIASILTPYGTRLAAYPLQMFSSQHLIMKFVQEWQAVNFSQPIGKFFLALLAIFWLGLVTSDLNLRVDDFLLLGFATAETLMHARFFLLFVPVFAPLAAELLRKWVPKYEPAKDHHVLNFVLMALIVTGIVISFPSRTDLRGGLRQKFPVKAIAFLREHPEYKRTFNDADWGSYMMYSLGPPHRVFIDGRYDIYEYTKVFSDYLAITRLSPNTFFLLRKYRVDSTLIPSGSPLATLLAASPGWIEVYQDKLAAIFVRGPAKRKQFGTHSANGVKPGGPPLSDKSAASEAETFHSPRRNTMEMQLPVTTATTHTVQGKSVGAGARCH